MDYAISLSGDYASILIGKDKHKLSRFIYYNLRKITSNTNRKIDHRDRDVLNNTIKNLQESTSSENNRNREKKSTSSKYNGVYKGQNLWICKMKYNDESYDVCYKDETHAAYHYDLLVKEFKLENFCTLNNIE